MKTNKEKLAQYATGWLDEEQCEMLVNTIRTLSNAYFTKGDLMEITDKGNTSGIDNALPLDYVNSIKEIHPNFSNQFHAYDYRENRHGEMLNVAENFLLKLSETLKK